MKVTSSKPKKQRKWHYSKPLHLIQKEFSVHLSKDLRKSVGKRSLEVRKGDTVKVLRGSEKYVGKQGKITSVLRQKRQVLIEGIIRKRTDGTEIPIPFRSSNLMLVTMEEKDDRRVKGKKVKKEEKVTKDGK